LRIRVITEWKARFKQPATTKVFHFINTLHYSGFYQTPAQELIPLTVWRQRSNQRAS